MCFSRKVMGHYLAAVCRSEEHVYAVQKKITVRLCNIGMTSMLGKCFASGKGTLITTIYI